MPNNTSNQDELVVRLTKLEKEYEIRISECDKDLFEKYCWSLMIGRNGHIYLHRTEKGKKIYFSRSVLERKLGDDYKLVKGESCKHIDGNSANKTRDNLGLKVSKKLAQQREALILSE